MSSLRLTVLEGSFTSALDVFLGIGFLLRPFRAYLETLQAVAKKNRQLWTFLWSEVGAQQALEQVCGLA